MRVRSPLIAIVPVVCVACAVFVAGAGAQRTDVFVASRDHPAVNYTKGAVTTRVEALNARLAKGTAASQGGAFPFDGISGYLKALLDALDVPIDSQVLVFSQTSAQFKQIAPGNPRAVFFNDTVAVGWVRGTDVIEVAEHDPRQGVIFYTLAQQQTATPGLRRDNSCLTCHLSWETLGVPGMMVLTTFPMPDDPNAYARGFVADHRSPLSQRWGGFYVTGQGPRTHMGNVPVLYPKDKPPPAGPAPVLASVEGRFDPKGFLSRHSDIAALLVLEHQTRMTNLITRLGWEARLGESPSQPPAPRAASGDTPAARVAQAAADLVDYLLFVDEEPLTGGVRGSSGFGAAFSARGPRDAKGRSLYQLDLQKRLLRYPCSYMIYAPAFDALPAAAKDAVYRRMWSVLSGQERKAPYDRLVRADRQAMVEILKDTKKELPAYFSGSVS